MQSVPWFVTAFFGVIVVMMVIVVVIIVAAVIYTIVVGNKKAQERRDALFAWATASGWSFDPSDDAHVDDQYRHFGLFNRGDSRRASNLVRGTLEINRRPHRFIMGDYTYVTTSRDSKGRTRRTTHRYAFLVLASPYPHLPGLSIRRESFFDKIGAFLGADDIDFEDADFSKRFHVSSKDRRFAYDLCSVRMIEFLKEHQDDAPAIELERGEVLLAEPGRWRTPAEFQRTLDFARAFVDRWPDHVLAELEGDSSFRTGIDT